MKSDLTTPRVLRGRWKTGATYLLPLFFAALMLTALAFFAAPAAFAFSGDGSAVAQDVDPDRGCSDAAPAEGGPGDHCCDNVAAAEGGPGDHCCDDVAAAHGGDECCDNAAAAEGGPGDDCDEEDCDVTAAHGRDDDCPLPCPEAPVAPAHGRDDHDDYACDTEDTYARIVSLPVAPAHGGRPSLEGLYGEWQIGDVTYTVTSTTKLEQHYGAFAVDKCVEVTWPITYPNFALEIETKPDHKCSDDVQDRSEIFGAIGALPDDPNLLGVWSVGEVTFTVTSTTELKSNLDDFVVGAFVKAHLRLIDGQWVARDVKALWPNHDDDWGWWKWRKGRAFGPIESLPAEGTTGAWVIAGVTYSVTERTRLDDDEGAFVVGANVKVEYWKTRDGDRVAHKIKTTDDTGNGNGQFRFVGVVDAKPEAFVGDWTIGGAAFVADANTVFDESKGLLIVDAYVSVRYIITDNMRLASEIKTVVPPGGGGHHHFGWIERLGTSTSSGVMAADGTAANTWRVGGVDYLITPETLLNDDVSTLAEGQLALVNAYAEADGTLVATSIDGITQDMVQFLPMLSSR